MAECNEGMLMKSCGKIVRRIGRGMQQGTI